MQTRFGMVLLVIISMISFMLGRSVKSQLEPRAPYAAAPGASAAGQENPDHGGGILNAEVSESSCVACHLDMESLKQTAAVAKSKKSALQSGAG